VYIFLHRWRKCRRRQNVSNLIKPEREVNFERLVATAAGEKIPTSKQNALIQITTSSRDQCYLHFKKYFRPKICVLFAQTSASFGKKLVITLFFFLEKRHFSRRKSLKIAIKTSTPSFPDVN
jgi:hypothetical protein